MSLEYFPIQSLPEISHESTVQEVIEGFKNLKVGVFLVVEEGTGIGLITKDDIIQKVLGRLDPKTSKAMDIMTAPIQCLEIEASVGEACIFSCEKRMKSLVIAQEGTIVGSLEIKELVPPEVLQQSVATEDFFIRVGNYGDELLEKEKVQDRSDS